MLRTWTLFIVLFAGLAFAVASSIYQSAFTAALDLTRAQGAVRLSEAASRLRLQLDEYRALVNFAAKDPLMALALQDGPSEDVSFELSTLRLTYGPWHVDLVDRSGLVVASSGTSRIGRRFSGTLLNAALNGRLGTQRAIEDGERLFRFSRGVWGDGPITIGAVVVSADMASLEFEWPVTPEPIVFFDQSELAFSANRPELLSLSGAMTEGEFAFPIEQLNEGAEPDLWSFRSGDEPAAQVLRLRRDIPQLELSAEIFLDAEPARETATLRFRLALALAGVVGLIAAVALQQRRRFALEARHSSTLEARVEARTFELRHAQNELVEASKLSALGRLSAGVSHELNQPLAAVLNFAENGRKFIQRGNETVAMENFEKIAGQVARINRIIGNLRAFARQEVASAERVDFAKIVRDALELAAPELEAAEIKLTATLPQTPIHVIAGSLRLEQIILNVVGNAKDAMLAQDLRQLEVELLQRSGAAILLVRDTGGGIKDPDRVFEPFYSTKDLGSSKGLGMGMALAFGIISKFGGTIACRNLEAGAEFRIELPIAEARDA